MLKNVSITKATKLMTMKKTFAKMFMAFLLVLTTYPSFFSGVSTVAFSFSLFYSSSFCSSSETSMAGLISSILFFYAAASASISISMLSFAATAFPATDILRGLPSSVSMSRANSSDAEIFVLWAME